MKKANRFLSYSFGFLTSLMGLDASAQTPKKVDLSASFDLLAKRVFATDSTKYFKTTNVAYYVDSAHIDSRNWGANTIITKRVSDKEQVMILAEDKDRNRVIEQEEVTAIDHYNTNDTIVTKRSLVKNPETGRYHVLNYWTAAKAGMISSTGTRAFDCKNYENATEWNEDGTPWSRTFDNVLWPFKR